MATTLKFRAHDNHLRNTVLRQAGTLWKAVLEGVMNSVDAGATYCNVTLTSERVTITDDGRGFQTEEEIEEYFQTFGTPHEDGDATYGEFRMGRCQIMAFGVNSWKTNNFVMDVDIRDKGMSFELKTDAEPFDGCSIDIKLYDELLIDQLGEVERELEKMVKYVSIPVTLNEEVISKDPSKEKWDHVTEDAYVKLRSTGELSIYNLGVYVCNVGSWQYGSGGTVVSRKRLKLNFARNDVMRRGHERCPVWEAVEPYLKTTVQTRNVKAKRLNDAARRALIADLNYNTIDEELRMEVADKRIFTDVSGRHHSINGLITKFEKCDKYTVAPKGNKIGERIHSLGAVFVFADTTAASLNCRDVSQYLHLRESLHDCYRHSRPSHATYFELGNGLKNATYVPLEALKGDFSEEFNFLKDKELTERQRIVLQILNRCQSAINNSADRKILIGESDVALAWTDGGNYVAIDHKFLKELMQRHNFNTNMFVNLGLLLSHEFAHNNADKATHDHDLEFFDTYESILEGTAGANVPNPYMSYRGLGQFVADCVNILPEYIRRAGRRLTKRQLAHLGRLEQSERLYSELAPQANATDLAEEILQDVEESLKTLKETYKKG